MSMAAGKGHTALQDSEASLNRAQRQYLEPLNTLEHIGQAICLAACRALVHLLLKTRVEGLGNLPTEPPYILAPSHTSSLDPFLLSTALPARVLKQCHWAAAARAVMKSPLRRAINRMAGTVPIWRGARALAVGAVVLERGRCLIWFPEGHRTRDGQLQQLRPGIGILAVGTRVPVVPIRIVGGYQAMPPGTHFPKFRSRVVVRIGQPLQVEHQADAGRFDEEAARFTEQLHAAMAALGDG